MANHAVLYASSSHLWMNCPPSVRLTERIPDNGSVYAAEGSEAHALCEYKLRQALGMEAENPLDSPRGLQYYDSAMEDAATGYVAFVLEQLEEIKRTCADPIIMVEQRLNFSRWVQDGFGTGDAVIVADGTLHITDFKYGTGVAVSADGNSQMRLYALGTLDMFDGLYDIETVVMTIYQPRLSNISTDTISKDTFDAVQAEIARRIEHFNANPQTPKSYPFSGLMVCEECGRHYRRKTIHSCIVWICETFNTQGKRFCASKQVPEETLKKVTAEALGTEEFDPVSLERVDSILVCNGNRLVFRLKDGAELSHQWKDRSRSQSWTPEMKEAARQKSLEMRKQHAQNNDDSSNH